MISFERTRGQRTLHLSWLIVGIGLALGTPAAAQTVERSAKVGKSVYEAVYNPADNSVYVALAGNFDKGGGGIAAVDAQTLSVKRVIEVGADSPFGIGLNAKTQRLYTTNSTTGSIGVYDVKTGKKLAIIKPQVPNTDKPHYREVAVDETTNTIYATGIGDYPSENGTPSAPSTLAVIDGATNTVKKLIQTPVKGMTGLAVDGPGRRAYVSGLIDNEIAVVDLDKLEVIKRYPSGGGKGKGGRGAPAPVAGAKPPEDTVNLAFDPATKRLVAVNQDSGGIVVLDAATGNQLKTVRTGPGALSARFNPVSGDIYIANRGDGTVTVVDGKTYVIKAHLPSGSYPQTVTVDPRSGTVFVTNKAKGKGWGAPEGTPDPIEPGGDTLVRIRP